MGRSSRRKRIADAEKRSSERAGEVDVEGDTARVEKFEFKRRREIGVTFRESSSRRQRREPRRRIWCSSVKSGNTVSLQLGSGYSRCERTQTVHGEHGARGGARGESVADGPV